MPDTSDIILASPIDGGGNAVDFSALDRLTETIRLQSEAFERSLEEGPQSAACGTCGTIATLCKDASWKAGRAVYICPRCENERKQRKLGERIEKAGIPSDVRHATLENFKIDRPNVNSKFQSPAQFLGAAREFLNGQKRNAVFGGTPGVGKGHLAAAIAIEYLRDGKRVQWVECARLFRDYHRAYENKTNEMITSQLGSAALLVLDEICLRALPSDGEEILFAVLDQRQKEGRKTILLANAVADEIKRWLGDRITDRLRSGGVVFRYGEWESMRGSEDDGATGNGTEF